MHRRSISQTYIKPELPKLKPTASEIFYDERKPTSRNSRAPRTDRLDSLRVMKNFYLVEPDKGSSRTSSFSPSLPPISNDYTFSIQQTFQKQFKELKAQIASTHYKEDNQLKNLQSQRPYSRALAKEFIKACRTHATTEVERLLFKDKDLLNVRDKLSMTGLHWAALRNYPDLVKLLISYGADLNAQDISHRTPLILALKKTNVKVVQELLIAKADPFIKTSSNKRAINFAKSEACKRLVQKAMMVHSMKKFTPKMWKEEMWNRAVRYFKDPVPELDSCIA
eukprot:CAMPEP_0204909860 /NCGR_PEP_ID=MMETSP1397-20131031/8489_1 /ASSEMBLY_ACC=CAM_ASM_000891 /TAXON_ID=49980 /ORGANISM="Climacostomum Climacostomum virens, Strain Stock W-24" /LENGTH=280 /DNA_ID=CAMNT_0052079805 /DNA_START=50 /DNA_END=892 /DNA_ORIENTATION=+